LRETVTRRNGREEMQGNLVERHGRREPEDEIDS
jgi:hypothetical protein